NNLHCLFLAGGENAIVTPTYYVYDLYKEHQGAAHIASAVTDKTLSVSASERDGAVTVTIANTSYDRAADIELSAFAKELGTKAEITTLAAEPHAPNTFENPDAVTLSETVEAAVVNGVLTLTAAPASVTRIVIR
ncbi:MAG: hypothetical protein IJ302_06945, partial [Clostridia bacterium]|nr:hypothetical protein [Clostridia bacterium]